MKYAHPLSSQGLREAYELLRCDPNETSARSTGISIGRDGPALWELDSRSKLPTMSRRGTGGAGGVDRTWKRSTGGVATYLCGDSGYFAASSKDRACADLQYSRLCVFG